jgi:hypothetical protein
MNNANYVTLEQAKLLKEKGFDDESCLVKINKDDKFFYTQSDYNNFPEHKDGKMYVRYIDKDTIPGYTTYAPLCLFEMKYEIFDFKKARFEFIKFKNDLNKMGLILEKI